MKTFVSSNKNKIEEYKKLGFKLKFCNFKDLKEVQGSDLEVILYKTLEIPNNYIIEDTSLNVEGFAIGVNIKWLVDSLKKDKKAN